MMFRSSCELTVPRSVQVLRRHFACCSRTKAVHVQNSVTKFSVVTMFMCLQHLLIGKEKGDRTVDGLNRFVLR